LTVTQNTISSLSFNTLESYGQSITGTVGLSNPAQVNEVVDLGNSNRSILHMPAKVTVPAGSSSVNFSVSVTVPVSSTVVSVSATPDAASDLGASGAGIGITVMPLIQSISFSPASVISGKSAVGTILLNAAPSTTETIKLSSNSIYAVVPAAVTVPACAGTVSFTLKTKVVANQITSTITASALGSKQTAQITLLPVPPVQLSLNTSTVIAGTTVTGTVTLNSPAPVGGAKVTLTSTLASYAKPAGSVVVPAGKQKAMFQIKTFQTPGPEAAQITAAYSGQSASSILTVEQNNIVLLYFNPNWVYSGQSAAGIVTLAGPAPTGGVTVSVSSISPYASVSANTVTVAAGSTTASFTANTLTGWPFTEVATFVASSAESELSADLTIYP